MIRPIATLLVGYSIFGLALGTQAQNMVSQDQKAALQVVAKMTEGQRTYYQNNGQFQAVINDLQKDFGVTLPATFDYAVRTTPEAAFVYIIPAQSPEVSKLNAYVGAAFINPNRNSEITTIICQNTTSGQVRPADPQLTKLMDLNPSNTLTLQCGEFSTQVPASVLTE